MTSRKIALKGLTMLAKMCAVMILIVAQLLGPKDLEERLSGVLIINFIQKIFLIVPFIFVFKLIYQLVIIEQNAFYNIRNYIFKSYFLAFTRFLKIDDKQITGFY